MTQNANSEQNIFYANLPFISDPMDSQKLFFWPMITAFSSAKMAGELCQECQQQVSYILSLDLFRGFID